MPAIIAVENLPTIIVSCSPEELTGTLACLFAEAHAALTTRAVTVAGESPEEPATATAAVREAA